jgi:hypothetical protein
LRIESSQCWRSLNDIMAGNSIVNRSHLIRHSLQYRLTCYFYWHVWLIYVGPLLELRGPNNFNLRGVDLISNDILWKRPLFYPHLRCWILKEYARFDMILIIYWVHRWRIDTLHLPKLRNKVSFRFDIGLLLLLEKRVRTLDII